MTADRSIVKMSSLETIKVVFYSAISSKGGHFYNT